MSGVRAVIRKGLDYICFDSLQVRAAVISCVLLLLPSLSILLSQGHYQGNLVEQHAVEQLQNGTAMQKAEIDRWFREQSVFVNNVADFQAVRMGQQDMIKDFFKVMVRNRAEFSCLALVDLQGNTVVDSRDIPPISVKDRLYFQRALTGQDVISEILISKISGKPVIVFASPVYGQDRKMTGVVYGSVEITVLQQIMERFRYGKTGVAFLVDETGQCMLGLEHSSSFLIESQRQLAGENKGYYSYVDGQGRHFLQVEQPLNYLGWRVVGQVSQEEIYFEYYQQLKHVGMGLLFVMLVLIPLALIAVRGQIKPILHLTEGAEKVQGGDYNVVFDQQLVKEASREIKILCIAFESMVRRLQENFTQLQTINQALTEAEATYRTLVESSLVGIYVVEKERFSYLNPKAREIFGIGLQEEIADKMVYEYIHPEDREQVRNETRERLKGVKKWESFTFRILRCDGKVRYLESHNAAGRMGRNQVIMGMILDITERYTMEHELRYSSMHDKLTGLFNRAHFERELKELAQQAGDTVGIVVADVNGLKLINDILGHQAGDALIKATAQILEQSFRDSDVVARIGGDEFAVLLAKTNERILKGVTRRISRRVAKHNLNHPRIPLSLSVGYAVAKHKGEKLEDIFREADDVMYRNKFQNREKSRQDILESFARGIESKESARAGHQGWVAKWARAVGEELGLENQTLDYLERAALYHDIGLVGIDDAILNKAGSLNEEEWAEIQRHPEIGQRLALALPELAEVAQIILTHHEWWDGSGYPQGLQGEEIPLEARIIGLVDAVESMAREQCYRKGHDLKEIREELIRCAGTQFDPALVEVFLGLLDKKGKRLFE